MNNGHWWNADSIDELPPSIAEKVNRKEGSKLYEIKSYEKIKKENKYLDEIIDQAATIKSIPKTYIPNNDINNIKKRENYIISKHSNDYIKNDKQLALRRKWFSSCYKGNFDKYVYGRLYAQIYKTGVCEIIEDTGKLYSWLNNLQGFYKKGYIHWYDIQNIDIYNSKLVYIFNSKNIKAQYADYLKAIEYCIDNNYDPRNKK